MQLPPGARCGLTALPDLQPATPQDNPEVTQLNRSLTAHQNSSDDLGPESHPKADCSTTTLGRLGRLLA